VFNAEISGKSNQRIEIFYFTKTDDRCTSKRKDMKKMNPAGQNEVVTNMNTKNREGVIKVQCLRGEN